MNELKVTINRCARCGVSHEGLLFKPFKNPVLDPERLENITLFSHWALCPTSGEPIVLKILPEKSSRY